MHLIDALNNPEAYIAKEGASSKRTFENWKTRNYYSGSIINELIKNPLFQRIYSSILNPFEELYVEFGTDSSRKDGIPTENTLWRESGAGFKIGYSPNKDFYISKEEVELLLKFYGTNIEAVKLAEVEDFDPIQALINSPSLPLSKEKNQWLLCKADTNLIDLMNLSIDPWLLTNYLTGPVQRPIVIRAKTTQKAYEDLGVKILEAAKKLPRCILKRMDVTLAYSYNPNQPPVHPLPARDPKTVLGLICYEQFYNKHKKLLLQVGDGTSLKETVKLHYQIYKPEEIPSLEGLDNAETIAQALHVNLTIHSCNSYGEETDDLQIIGQSEHPVIEVVRDTIAQNPLYFLVVDPKDFNPPQAPDAVTPRAKSAKGLRPSPKSPTHGSSTKPKAESPAKPKSSVAPKPKPSPSSTTSAKSPPAKPTPQKGK
ncbi:MAG: hypothetical protein LBF43_00730 [Puniceicoccales bacterium]|nr:hypothetical protein [Puniceicoccales bacterium]